MQQEVERAEIGQLKAFDFAFADSGEVLFDALGGDFSGDDRVILRLAGDQPDIGRVAFVTGTGVRDFQKLNFHGFAEWLWRLFELITLTFLIPLIGDSERVLGGVN